MLKTSTYIIIPAYNEEKSIGKVIESLLSLNYDKIVVVNDGSSDQTCQIVKKYPVCLINHLINLGQGAALQTGMEYAQIAGAKFMVHFDADGQHQVKDIEKFITDLKNGYDIVMGSRFLQKNTQQQVPWSKKYFILKPGIFVNWIFTGLKLTDTHNGFRALSHKGAEFIKISQNGMAHPTEIQALVKRHNLKFKEVPVEIKYFHYGQNMAGGVRIIVDLLKKSFI